MAACQDVNSKLDMYFTVSTAFINYSDKFSHLTESLELPIIKSKTTFKQTLHISLNISKFDSTLLTALSDLKDFIHWYTCNKEISDLQERHDNMALNTNKNFFSDNYVMGVFLFITAIGSLLATTLTIYLLCKKQETQNTNSQSCFATSKKVGTVKEINTECEIHAYISLDLTILGLVMVAILHYRKSKLCRGCMFSNAVKIMIFISDVQYYVPIKSCLNCRKHPSIQNYRHTKFRKY